MKNTVIQLPFCTILALIFITLKLTEHIDWSWVWVLAPLWIPFAIILLMLIIGVAGLCIAKKMK